MKAFHLLTWILLIIGGLNWLLVVFGGDIATLLGLSSAVAKIIYVLVGLSAIVQLFTHNKNCKACSPGMSMGNP